MLFNYISIIHKKRKLTCSFHAGSRCMDKWNAPKCAMHLLPLMCRPHLTHAWEAQRSFQVPACLKLLAGMAFNFWHIIYLKNKRSVGPDKWASPAGKSRKWCHLSHYTIVVHIFGEHTASKEKVIVINQDLPFKLSIWLYQKESDCSELRPSFEIKYWLYIWDYYSKQEER